MQRRWISWPSKCMQVTVVGPELRDTKTWHYLKNILCTVEVGFQIFNFRPLANNFGQWGWNFSRASCHLKQNLMLRKEVFGWILIQFLAGLSFLEFFSKKLSVLGRRSIEYWNVPDSYRARVSCLCRVRTALPRMSCRQNIVFYIQPRLPCKQMGVEKWLS